MMIFGRPDYDLLISDLRHKIIKSRMYSRKVGRYDQMEVFSIKLKLDDVKTQLLGLIELIDKEIK